MKKTALPKPVPPEITVPDTELSVRVLKSSTCSTLSGRSTLTYQIGSTADAVSVIRLKSNTGGGFFNRDWIELSVIRSLLESHPAEKQVTSFLLFPLFKGKSANSPAFLFAVLIAEGLVTQSGEKPLIYHKGDTEPFFTEVEALMAAEGDESDCTADATVSQGKPTQRKKSSEKTLA